MNSMKPMSGGEIICMSICIYILFYGIYLNLHHDEDALAFLLGGGIPLSSYCLGILLKNIKYRFLQWRSKKVIGERG